MRQLALAGEAVARRACPTAWHARVGRDGVKWRVLQVRFTGRSVLKAPHSVRRPPFFKWARPVVRAAEPIV
jgi:hypothetical protein